MDSKVSELCEKLYGMAKANPERRFYSLYDKIQRMDVLKEAWLSVVKNDGSPGTDGETIKEIKEKGYGTLLEEIQQELTYIRLMWGRSRSGHRLAQMAVPLEPFPPPPAVLGSLTL